MPIVIGGLIAVVGGLLGAWIQARRAHKKWLREKRLEAYIPIVAFLTEYEIVLSGLADVESRVRGIAVGLSDSERPLVQGG